MALNANRLGDAMAAAVQALYTAPVSPADVTKLQQYMRAIATSIVSEIQTNAVVNPGTLAVTPSNMSNGAGALGGNGAVTTGTGTVT